MDIEEMQRAVEHFMAEPWLNTLLDVLEEYRTIKNGLHTLEKERDEALAKLAAMESQEPIVAYKIDDGTTSGYVFTDHQGIVELEELYGVKSTPLVECKPARITEQDAHDKNSQRYLWIKENIQEEPTQESLNDSEYAEHKTCYKLPLLISWADFCGRISLDDAIDNQISRGDSCSSNESEGE